MALDTHIDLAKGLPAIRDMFASVQPDDNPDRIARALLRTCHALFCASAAALVVDGKPVTRYTMTRDQYKLGPQAEAGWTTLPERRGLAVRAMDEAVSLAFPPAGGKEDEDADWDADGLPGVSQPHHILAAPLTATAPAPGSLILLFEQPLPDANAVLDNLARLAEMAQLAFQQQLTLRRLRKLSTTDDLTGAYNYRYLLDSLGREIKRAHRFKQVLSFVMLDVDHLKEYNDVHGHLAGSRLLTSFAQIVQSQLRAVDTLAKYGGDEFGVILPQTAKGGAKIVAERIRAAVESHHFPGEKRKITASLGVASFPEDGEVVETLLGRADEALYRAKNLGRNRVCLVGEEVAGRSGETR
ncbi:MAG: GGDEF domain-containing protein [Candidatus Eisenbacteria sp.]|nr:GGDEF domain-containing protein [Candidatus Eisenbacteria bacterium]